MVLNDNDCEGVNDGKSPEDLHVLVPTARLGLRAPAAFVTAESSDNVHVYGSSTY